MDRPTNQNLAIDQPYLKSFFGKIWSFMKAFRSGVQTYHRYHISTVFRFVKWKCKWYFHQCA